MNKEKKTHKITAVLFTLPFLKSVIYVSLLIQKKRQIIIFPFCKLPQFILCLL